MPSNKKKARENLLTRYLQDLNNGYKLNVKGEKIPLDEETTKKISICASRLAFRKTKP